MQKMNIVDYIAMILLVIGGLNWGLVGVAQYDVVAKLFGGTDALLSVIVYCLVGLSALYMVVKMAMGGKKAAPAPTQPTM